MTNATSLLAKMDSFIETLNELGSDLAIISETWMNDSRDAVQLVQDIEGNDGFNLIRKDRKALRTGGWVAICYRKSVSYTHLTLPTIYSV